MQKSKFIKAGLGYTIGNLLVKGVVFLTTPLFTRVLTQTEFGLVGAFLSYEAILMVLISIMLHSSIKNAFVDLRDQLDVYVSNIVTVIIANTIFFMILVLLFNRQFTSFTNITLQQQILLVITSGGMSLINVYNSKLSMEYEYKKYLLISVINSVFNIAISLLLIYTIMTDDKVSGRILGYSIPVAFIALYIIIVTFTKRRPSLNTDFIKYAFGYSLPLLFLGLSDVVLAQSDRIFIQIYEDEYVLSFYTLSYSIYSIISIFRNSVELVWIPTIFGYLKNEEYEKIRIKSKMYVDITLIFTIFVLLLSPEIIYVLGGSKYSESLYSTVPLIISSFVVMILSLPQNVMYFYKNTKALSVFYLLSTLLNIGINWIFIPKYGYLVAALTTLFSYMFLVTVNFIYVKYIVKKSIFNIGYITFLFLIICTLGAIVLIVNNLLVRIICLGVVSVLFLIKYKMYVNIAFKTIIRYRRKK